MELWLDMGTWFEAVGGPGRSMVDVVMESVTATVVECMMSCQRNAASACPKRVLSELNPMREVLEGGNGTAYRFCSRTDSDIGVGRGGLEQFKLE